MWSVWDYFTTTYLPAYLLVRNAQFGQIERKKERREEEGPGVSTVESREMGFVIVKDKCMVLNEEFLIFFGNTKICVIVKVIVIVLSKRRKRDTEGTRRDKDEMRDEKMERRDETRRDEKRQPLNPLTKASMKMEFPSNF